MTTLEHRSINPPSGRKPRPGSTPTRIVIVIVVIAVWAALVANGAPPQATAVGLGAAARVALHLASSVGRSPQVARGAGITARGWRPGMPAEASRA